MRITAIQPQKNHPERVNVHVDGAFRLALAAEIVLAEGLRTGDAVDEALLAALEARDQAWKAREAALHLLAFRPRSAAEVRQRLTGKGYPPEVAEQTVARLLELGMLDDAAFAGSFVRDRVKLRPHGKRRLQQELRRKGVAPALAREVIEATLEGEDTSELELARAAAARWRVRPGEERQAARRRLYGFLARRGFGGDAVAAVLAERLGGDPDPPD